MRSRGLVSCLLLPILMALRCHGLVNVATKSNHHKRVGESDRSFTRPRGSSGLHKASFGIQRKKSLTLRAVDDDNQEKKKTKKRKKNPKKDSSDSNKQSLNDERSKKKAEIMQQLKEKLEAKKVLEGKKDGGILGKLNPFQAGQNLRQTIGELSKLRSGLSPETKQKYYLDDRVLGGMISEKNPYLERLERDDFVPEVLVIGATGEVGRLVVRRLLLEGRFRVRVLVRDLYSQTLNLLGTGVTYCQGDLSNVDSLEYALTDVDKIVFCAGAPRPDEQNFQLKFQNYVKENLEGEEANREIGAESDATSDVEWEKLNSVLEVRASLAEQVDYIGMQNLVKAYQDVRHIDYGTSQSAKRSLFKFSGRAEDFNLFSLDEDDSVDIDDTNIGGSAGTSSMNSYGYEDEDAEYDDDDYDDDDYDDDSYYDELYNVESRQDANVKSQVKWMRNQFDNGVFVGKVPKESGSGVGGEAAIVSSRLRSREDPENGIDLSGNFAGFIVRLCSGGEKFEAFVRTGLYEENGIEYVCEFSTFTKATTRDNKSRQKFITVRLSFDDFKPVRRKGTGDVGGKFAAQPFDGSDVRHIGFRFRSASNKFRAKYEEGDFSSFYLALSYVKVYRMQPEPEFIYLSDARIPPHVRNGMVRHERRELLHTPSEDLLGGDGDIIKLFDQNTLAQIAEMERSSEETYFKYRGEEVLKNSGLSYTIIRVSGFNEVPSGEASTIDLRTSNEGICPVSRDEVAQVCVGALLDPRALNKCVYVSKKLGTGFNENLSAKFAALETIP